MLEVIKKAYLKASMRVIFLDYDGTMVPFSRIPSEARISDDSASIIRNLALIPENRIVIISGRDRNFLDEQFKDISVDLIAEHGFLIREKQDDEWKYPNGADTSWKSEASSLFSEITRLIPGTFTEEKEVSLVLHYRLAQIEPKTLEEVKELVDRFSDRHPSMDVLYGNRVIEVKAGGFNKGTAALSYIEKLEYDFLLALGDDVTDETLFKEIRRKAFTVKVGLGPTCAEYRLPFQKDVIPFLRGLI